MRIQFTLTVAFILNTAAIAAELVVISSNSPSYTPGSILDGSSETILAKGETLTLVTQQGKILKLQGPYQGKPHPVTGDSKNSLLESLSKIVTESEEAAALAVFRRANKKRGPWSIRVNKNGTYCLVDQTSTTLWRPKPLSSSNLEITHVADDISVNVNWEEGQETLSWPANLQLEDNVLYKLSIQDQIPTEILVRVLPSDMKLDAYRIIWMSEAGCTKQTRALLESM